MSEFKKAKNLYFKNENLYNFMVEESEELGLSLSGYINFLISQRKSQKENMQTMKTMASMISQMSDIQGIADGQMDFTKMQNMITDMKMIVDKTEQK